MEENGGRRKEEINLKIINEKIDEDALEVEKSYYEIVHAIVILRLVHSK